ncbi:hypothetical protein M885DRAFT_495426 [Pelagophyceae sp. CCMP2097]|nr:hypothetical protein M885DRAFT_495426 [Pelagophyceae sp. CCMP2097]
MPALAKSILALCLAQAFAGYCCLWSSSTTWPGNACAACDDVSPDGEYCSLSKYNCESVCKDAAWCDGDGDMTDKPVAKPTTAYPTAKPTSYPTAKPVAKPTTKPPTFSPTAEPTAPTTPGDGTCCYFSHDPSWPGNTCAPCVAPATSPYCMKDEANCVGDCKGKWCPSSGPVTSAPTPKPTPKPTLKPVGDATLAPTSTGRDGYCCLWSASTQWATNWGGSACAPCSEIAPPSHFCAQSQYNCDQKCDKAQWCAGEVKVPRVIRGKCCYYGKKVNHKCGSCKTWEKDEDHFCNNEDNCNKKCGSAASWCRNLE